MAIHSELCLWISRKDTLYPADLRRIDKELTNFILWRKGVPRIRADVTDDFLLITAEITQEGGTVRTELLDRNYVRDSVRRAIEEAGISAWQEA